jgi:hypothetical protein
LTFSAFSQNQLEIFGLAKDTPEPKAGESDLRLYCDAELTICALDGGQCASLDDEYSEHREVLANPHPVVDIVLSERFGVDKDDVEMANGGKQAFP